MRLTLEWLFVAKLVKEWKLEMHDQLEQVIKYYMQFYVNVVNDEDGGIRPHVAKICQI